MWQRPEAIPNVDPGKISAGWALTSGDKIKTSIPGLMVWNGGLRARFRYHESEPHAQLRLRDREGNGWNVIIAYDAIHFRTHDLSQSPDYQNQGKQSTPLPKEGGEYQLELVAVGRNLFGKLNGQSFSFDMGENAGPAQPGGMYLLQTHFNPFRDVEVINLDGLSEAEALKLVNAKP